MFLYEELGAWGADSRQALVPDEGNRVKREGGVERRVAEVAAASGAGRSAAGTARKEERGSRERGQGGWGCKRRGRREQEEDRGDGERGNSSASSLLRLLFYARPTRPGGLIDEVEETLTEEARRGEGKSGVEWSGEERRGDEDDTLARGEEEVADGTKTESRRSHRSSEGSS
ncbi:hypothetical protein AXG93_2097s1060 [Marchantia polymorpha subsp. ruderalis]|uniref:Uncharacterized protein n=1 Tax=Marchantia polymorpha subsp. ruderalis TaxID=1480154 RepID=A0A176W150_MARPO|nr:hypothetical protein AXG93_2097s1060 [Marchantia polymorpha subsp. ruderalis]